MKLLLLLTGFFLTTVSLNLYSVPVFAAAPYAQSSISVSFDTASKKSYSITSGSDNWPVTWADDDAQYTNFGDGGGFGDSAKYSQGVAKISGGADNFTGQNLWTGNGKSYGIISVGGILYMWVCGNASDNSAYSFQKLYKSTTHGTQWAQASWQFDQSNGGNFFCPTFLQYGKDYAGGDPSYLYIYAPGIQNSTWDVQKPGYIYLMRVPKSDPMNRANYQFFTGYSGGVPQWNSNVSLKKPVFTDVANGVMRTSAVYNAGLKKYFLVTQQIKRGTGGYIGIYEAPAPWGDPNNVQNPWKTVLFANAWSVGLQGAEAKTVFWNFSNKWTSADGKNFVFVYTGADKLSTIKGTLSAGPGTATSTPAQVTPTKITLSPTIPVITGDLAKPGDANGDGKVDGLDYVIWLNNYNKSITTGAAGGDFDKNGKVDGLDYVIWLNNYNK